MLSANETNEDGRNKGKQITAQTFAWQVVSEASRVPSKKKSHIVHLQYTAYYVHRMNMQHQAYSCMDEVDTWFTILSV